MGITFLLKERPACCRRAENETRTRDPNLGKVVLYQLSYFRRDMYFNIVKKKLSPEPFLNVGFLSEEEETRTPTG